MTTYQEQRRRKELGDHTLNLWLGFAALASLAAWFSWGLISDIWNAAVLKEVTVKTKLEEQSIELQIDPEFAHDAQFTVATATNLNGDITLVDPPTLALVVYVVALLLSLALVTVAVTFLVLATRLLARGHGFSRRTARCIQLTCSFTLVAIAMSMAGPLSIPFTTDLGDFDGISGLAGAPDNPWFWLAVAWATFFPVGLAGVLGSHGTQLEHDTKGLI